MILMIKVPPPPAGYLAIGDLKIAMQRKPFWLHRVAMRFVFGWVWVPA